MWVRGKGGKGCRGLTFFELPFLDYCFSSPPIFYFILFSFFFSLDFFFASFSALLFDLL